MARIQMSYPGFGTDALEVLIPHHNDVGSDKSIPLEVYYGKKFPVLWLLHGVRGTGSDWTRYTELERYAIAKRIFVVCIAGANSFYADMAFGKNYDGLLTGYVWDLIHDMFPLASERREDNFIAGLSMGGYGALRIGLAHPEKYCRIGSFSGAVSAVQHYAEGSGLGYDRIAFGDQALGSVNDLWAQAERVIKQGNAPEIYLSCGTKDGLYDDNIKFRAHLKELGFRLTWDEEDYDHDWPFWNHQVGKFIELMP